MLVALGLIGVLVYLAYWYSTSTFKYWEKRGVPFCKPVPLFGNLGQSLLMTKCLGEIYDDLYHQYPKHAYVGTFKFRQPALLIKDADIIRDLVTKDFNSFAANDVEVDVNVDPVFGRNPFVLTGHKWKTSRGYLTSNLTNTKIKNMHNVMVEVGKSMTKYLHATPEAKNSEGLEVKELCCKFFTDVMASIGFGLEGKCFEDPNSEFRVMWRKMLSPGILHMIQATVVMVLPGLARLLKVKFFSDEIVVWFKNIIAKTMQYRNENNVVRKDFLEYLIELSKKPENPISEEDVMAYSVTLFSEGFETSSTTMSFTLYEIAANPDVQAKLHEEVDRVLAKHGGAITFEAVHEMTYLDSVLNESLRLHPPAMFLMKRCTNTYQLPPAAPGLPELKVEPGIPVVFSYYSIHRDPQYWQEPEKFKPERFSEEESKGHHKFSFLPFGEGPRQCPGMRLAQTQVKTGLAIILSQFHVKANPKTITPLQIDPQYFLLGATGGLWLNFTKRKSD